MEVSDWLEPLGEDLVGAVVYGSEKRDVDILVITRSEPRTAEFTFGILDVLALSVDQLLLLCELRDPWATEPLLTGRIVRNASEIEAAKGLLRGRPSEAAVSHLLRQSAKWYLSSSAQVAALHAHGSQTAGVAAVVDAGFALSCLYLARAYVRIPDGEWTLAKLKALDERFAETMSLVSRVKTGDCVEVTEAVRAVISAYESELAG